MRGFPLGAAKRSRRLQGFVQGLPKLREQVAAGEHEVAHACLAPLRLHLAGTAGEIETGASLSQRLGGGKPLFGIDRVRRAEHGEFCAAGLEAFAQGGRFGEAVVAERSDAARLEEVFREGGPGGEG